MNRAGNESNHPLNSSRRKKTGIKSFENLVALANAVEKWNDVQRGARKMVWRDVGETPAVLQSLEECIRHAAKGGIRAALLAFVARSGVNVFLLLFRILKTPRTLRLALVRHAIFGSDSFRFAAMLGSFVTIYKFLLNALPLIPTPHHSSEVPSPPQTEYTNALDLESVYVSYPESSVPTPTDRLPAHRDPRFHLSASAVVAQRIIARKRWQAALAGFVAGLAVAFEKKGRRVTIAQQLFVRGLQGSYNSWSDRFGFRVPHGDSIVFVLCCAQIMYGFLLRPDTIPHSYNVWIQKASKVLPQAVSINRSLVREGHFDISEVEQILNWRKTTTSNRTELLSVINKAHDGNFGQVSSCAIIHPWLDSCLDAPLDRFLTVSKWMLPIYGALHFIPMLLFKRHVVFKHPARMLFRAAAGTLRSAAFLGVFVTIYQTWMCMKAQLYLSRLGAKLPDSLRRHLIGKPSFYLGGALSGLSIFVEERRRREELAMYVLPKGLESIWRMLRGHGQVPFVPFGESILCAIGMGMVMSTYQHDPEHLSGLVRRILYQFIGPN